MPYDKIVMLDENRMLHTFQFFLPSRSGQTLANQVPFIIDPFNPPKFQRMGVTFDQMITNIDQCFATTKTGKFLVCVGFWDNTIKIFDTDNYKLIQSVCFHQDVVTCVTIDDSDQFVVTGSRDGSVIVWRFNPKSGELEETPLHVLIGHDDTVTSVDVDSDLDLVVSGSQDSTCILYSLSKGRYIRSIIRKENAPISRIKIISEGYIILFCSKNRCLSLYSLNAKLMKDVLVSNITCWFFLDHHYFLIGSNQGRLEIRKIHNLKMVEYFQFNEPLTAITASEHYGFLIIGLMNGKMMIAKMGI
ncbi:beach domain-containing protein [Anaeramoeba ignava]|uniref:Beach domain-containing protein n=1 Tax=Anaeramoeba ignava TaxID=1746090 RepID=A0A9Q0LBF0_ANAIG|nr:beach domain-containing protein [Anaeramoeba ignava]